MMGPKNGKKSGGPYQKQVWASNFCGSPQEKEKAHKRPNHKGL